MRKRSCNSFATKRWKGGLADGLGADEMRGERDLRAAHGPDVQVVHGLYAGELFEITLDGVRVNVLRHRVKRQRQRLTE